jgi:hypothetical protein
MKFLRKLFFPPRPAERYYRFRVQCKRCGEMLDGRVDLYNDPSLDYESETPVYFCRKVLMGSGPCYQQIEAAFKFDEARSVLERQAAGGEFVEE